MDAIAAFTTRVAQAAQDHPPDEPFDRSVALSQASSDAPEVEAALAELDAYRATSC